MSFGGGCSPAITMTLAEQAKNRGKAKLEKVGALTNVITE